MFELLSVARSNVNSNGKKLKTSGYATWFTAGVQSASLITTSLMTS